MTKSFLIAGIVLGVLAILCGIGALATANWMKACGPFMDLMKAVLKISQASQEDIDKTINDPSLAVLQDAEVCFSVGLFRFSYYLTKIGFNMSFALSPNAFDIFVEAVAGLTIAGVLLLILAVVFLSLSVCSRSMNAQRKVSASAYGRIGVGILIAATALYGIGMTVYTAEQSKSVHNSSNFFMQIGSAMQSIMQNMGNGNSMFGNMANSGYGRNGRKRRQSDSFNNWNNFPQYPTMASLVTSPDLSKFPFDQGDSFDWNNLPQYPTMPDLSKFPIDESNDYNYLPKMPKDTNQVFGHQDSSSNQFPSGVPSKAEMEQIMQAIFGHMDPVFGYSLYLGWVGFVFAFLAMVITALTCRRSSLPYGDDLQPVL